MHTRLYEFDGFLYLLTETDDEPEHRMRLGTLDDPWTGLEVMSRAPELCEEYERLRAEHEDAVRAGEAYEREARTYR